MLGNRYFFWCEMLVASTIHGHHPHRILCESLSLWIPWSLDMNLVDITHIPYGYHPHLASTIYGFLEISRQQSVLLVAAVGPACRS